MALLQQKAGDFKVTVYTDGYPPSIEIKRTEWPEGELKLHGMEMVYDLRYALDRIISQYEAVKK